MACYYPMRARQEDGGPVIINPRDTANMELPCGRCLGCRTAHALMWARRCQQEASLYRFNSFVTLTYDDNNLPPRGELTPRHVTLFLKKLRKLATQPNNNLLQDEHLTTIRYFYCGEYGETTFRPHYHLLLFNCGFADAVPCGKDLFSSKVLADLWRYGIHKIGSVTGASANYCAQYALKKIGDWHHMKADMDGVIWQDPFIRMSRMPGLGWGWVERYYRDLSHGYMLSEGKPGPIPRLYLTKLEDMRPLFAERIKLLKQRYREEAMTEHSTPQAREAAARIHHRRADLTQTRKKVTNAGL